MPNDRDESNKWPDEEGCTITETTSLLRPHAEDDGSPESSPNGVVEEERTVIAKDVSFIKLALIMSTAWFGVFLGAADSTVIATLSGPISSEFDSLRLLSWLATAYLISNAACQPISGRLTDIFGRGPGLVFSNIVFAAGNLICGLAKSQNTMIIGRVVAGIGGGGLMSIPTFLGSDLVPLRRRGLVGGIANLWYGSGAMLGSVIGGFINDRASMGWRLAFLIQVPLSLVSAVVVYLLVKVPPKQSDKSYLARIDFLGGLLTSSFLVFFVLGLNSGGNLVPWTHPLPPTMLSLSMITFVAFVWWESKSLQPIIPVKLLRDRTIQASCLASLFLAMVAMTCIFYVPLFLQVLGDSPTDAGIKILPASVGTSVGALGAGYIMKRTGKYVWLLVFSILILIIGIMLFTLQEENSPLLLTSVAYFFVGGGYNAVFTITQIACIAAVDHSQQAVVTSATYLARSLGGTAGITIASAVYQGVLNSKLWERFGNEPNAAEAIRRIQDDLSELQRIPNSWHDGVLRSFIEAFRGVWFVTLTSAVLALICVAPMKQHKLHSTLDRK